MAWYWFVLVLHLSWLWHAAGMSLYVFCYVYVHKQSHACSIPSWVNNHFCFDLMPTRKAFEEIGGIGQRGTNSEMLHFKCTRWLRCCTCRRWLSCQCQANSGFWICVQLVANMGLGENIFNQSAENSIEITEWLSENVDMHSMEWILHAQKFVQLCTIGQLGSPHWQCKQRAATVA